MGSSPASSLPPLEVDEPLVPEHAYRLLEEQGLPPAFAISASANPRLGQGGVSDQLGQESLPGAAWKDVELFPS